MEITDEDRAELGRLVKEGFTNGILDACDENGISTRISWEIKTDKFYL